MEALSQSMETFNFLTTLPTTLSKLLEKCGEKNLKKIVNVKKMFANYIVANWCLHQVVNFIKFFSKLFKDVTNE
jgi:hypothetical protein